MEGPGEHRVLGMKVCDDMEYHLRQKIRPRRAYCPGAGMIVVSNMLHDSPFTESITL